MPASSSGTSQPRQRGFTLVELMVSLAIGLLLIAAMALVFSNSSRSGNELEKSMRQIENGRYGMELLSEDISLAGYYAEVPVSRTAATVSPCASSATLAADLDVQRAASPPTLPFQVQGFTAVEADALTCLPNRLSGTLALVVRRLDTTAVPVGSMVVSNLYVQSSNCSSDVSPTYLAALSSSALTLRNFACTGVNPVRRFVSRVYYVASCDECGLDTIPTLKRAELSGTDINVTPLAEGIQWAGFDFGFDTNADGLPDTWLGLGGSDTAAAAASTAATALGWGNVVGVRISLLASTTEPSVGYTESKTFSVGLSGTSSYTIGPYADAFKRRVYNTTVRVNNVAGWREVPP